MKLLLTSDWQCSLSNLNRCEVMLQQLCALIDQHEPNAVVHLGDVKEDFNPLDVRVANWLVKATELISDKTSFLVMLGNHDRISTHDDSDHIMPIIYAALSPKHVSRTFSMGDSRFYLPDRRPQSAPLLPVLVFAPFVRDLNRQKEMLACYSTAQSKSSSPAILFFHREIDGSSMGGQRTVTGGLKLEDLHPERYLACFGGHLHLQQHIKPNVWYVGSPFTMDWGEANQEKGFLLVEVYDKRVQVTRIPSKLPGWYDPLKPGFPAKRRNWIGCRIRLHTNSGYTEEHSRAAAEKKYPGAELVIVQAQEVVEVTTPKVNINCSDEELFHSYLYENPMPVGNMEQAVAYLKSIVPPAPPVANSRLERVRARNVLCFETVDLTLAGKGITLVTGENRDWPERSNGAGKTSAMVLPLIALFGSNPKGQEFDDWRRKGAPDDDPSTIQLDGWLADGRPFQILRQRKPASLRFLVDGRDWTMGEIRATQKLIEDTTGLTWDVALNSVYIGQQEITTILTGTPKERKELFSRFLGLERYLQAQEKVRASITRCNQRMVEVQADVDLTATLLQRETEALPSDQLRAQAADDYETCLREQAKLDEHCAAMRKLATMAKQRENRWNESARKEQIKKERQGRKLAIATTKLEAVNERLAELAGGKCPTCKRPWDPGLVAGQRAELQRRAAELQGQAKATNCASYYEFYMQRAAKARRSYERACQKLRNDELRLTRLEAQIKECARVREEQNQVQKRIAKLEHALQLHKDHVVALKEHLEFLPAISLTVGRDYGIPAYLCRNACPKLSRTAATYSDLFTTGEVSVKFKTDGKDLEVEVVNQHGGDGISAQSMGEARLAGLIAALSLREALAPGNLLILDEPGEGLDQRNAADLARALNEVAARFGAVYVTTHNPYILSALDPVRHLHVIKHHGVATVYAVSERENR